MSTAKKKATATATAELVTEFAIGSDGHLYVSAEGFTRGDEVGRKRFVGYQLNKSEAARVWDQLHSLAFNATAPLRRRRRRR